MSGIALQRGLPFLILLFTSILSLSAQPAAPSDLPVGLVPSDRLQTALSLPSWLLPSNAVSNISGLDGVVRALAQRENELYVAGDFSTAGDNVVGYVVRWDGNTWNPLGDFPVGLDGPAQALAIDGDRVYIGGNFTQAGPLRTRNIARWDRSTNTWSALGGGVGGTLRNGVSAIAVHNDNVYAAGSFIAAGKIVAANIARWDGTRWHRVGTGINNSVRALYIDGDYLYAGGEFTIAGDVRARGIARYHLPTGRWENAGVDIDGSVNAIASDDRYLYVGGVFDSVAGQLVNNIIRIEKSTGKWSPLYKGVIGYNYTVGGGSQRKGVETILIRGDHIFVGGTIIQTFVETDTGTVAINTSGIVQWDGTSWSNFALEKSLENQWNIIPGLAKGGPAPPNVYALVESDDDTVIVGGDFKGFANLWPAESGDAPYLCKFVPDSSVYAYFNGVGRTRQSNDIPSSILGSDDRMAEIATSRANANGDSPDQLLRHRFNSSPAASGTSPQSFGPVPDDVHWSAVGPDATTDNGVMAMASAGNEVYAGGTFVNIFGIEANGIAVRRNKEWFPLDDGTAFGVDGFVFAIAVKGSKVYVGGQFSKAGGIEANNFAIWDRNTRTWSTFGDGLTGDGTNPSFVSDILLVGDEIYVGGNFATAGEIPAKNIARWNDGEWSSLGEGIDGRVNSLEYFRGNIYAGGSFSRAGDITSNGIAMWDGVKWIAMQGGLDGAVNDMTLYYSFPGDTMLAIGGEFTKKVDTLILYITDVDSTTERIVGTLEGPAKSDPGRNLVWWNGSGWRLFQTESEADGSGLFSSDAVRMGEGVVRKLIMHGTDLYVCGSFDDAFPRGNGSTRSPLNNIGVFNRYLFNVISLSIWHLLEGGVNGNVNAMTISNGELIIGGDFTKSSSGDLDADHVGIWSLEDMEWRWAGNPTPLAPVEALTMHRDTLYASGSFVSQEIGLFDITNYLVRLTSVGWRIVEGAVRGTTFSLASAPGSELFAGGTIISSNENISVNVCRWNSDARGWSPLTPGSGVASLEDISFVSAVVADDENVYVAGDFDIADTLAVNNIAYWNRTTGQWGKLAEGLNGTVYALLLAPDGTLFAGGTFSRSGSMQLHHVAQWDGVSWQPLGDGIDGAVYSLAFADSQLYAGGTFDTAGSVAALNVARWDPASRTWNPLGRGLNAEFGATIRGLVVSDGRLFAAGKFDVSGTDSLHNIARWHSGGWWEALGSGTDRPINALTVGSSAGSIYAGGHFSLAGSRWSRYVGLWNDPTLSISDESIGATTGVIGTASPNPFSAETAVRLHIPAGKNRVVRLRLCDPTGRELATLFDGSLPQGDHALSIDGSRLSSGVYFLQMQLEEKTEFIKLVRR